MAATTWDPSHSGANNTLSGGNLVVTIGATNSIYTATFSTNPVTTGTYYFELVATGTGWNPNLSALIGIGNTSSVTNSWVGSFPNTLGIEADGVVFNNGASVATFAVVTSGLGVACFALDMTNKKLWIRTDAGNWNNDVIGNQNPATNTGGLTIPSAVYASPVVVACNTFNNTGASGADVITARFSSASWANTAPSGFVSLDAAPAILNPYNPWVHRAPILAQ